MGDRKSKLLSTPILLTKSTVFKELLLKIDQLNKKYGHILISSTNDNNLKSLFALSCRKLL